jgi:hypothetical protein
MNSSTPFGLFPEPISRPTGTRRNTSRSALRIICLALVALGIIAVMPALGGTKYMAGSPELAAHIAGTNEFSPGDDVNLQVVVENTGLVQFRIVQSGILDPADLSNTAKQLTVDLGSGSAPIVVKADPQVIGDLAGGSTSAATFHIKVNRDAAAGTYVLPVALNYTYLYQQEQTGTDTISYVYKDVNKNVGIPIKIKSEVQIDVTNVSAESLNAGNEGYVALAVKNIGYENGRNATVRIEQNGQSPVTPTEGGVYIGDFPAGSSVDCRFRVSVSGDAQEKSYPLDVYVNYKNAEGDFVDSKTETIGVPVGQKVDFNVTSVSTTVTAGAKSVLKVRYQNTGGATAYNAQARISAVDPFTSNDDTAFLGTMAPGDVRDAAFEVSVDAGATAKEYGLDSEVIYRDSLDNQFTSDPVKVNVQIVPAKSIIDVLGLPGIAAIILVIIAAAGYFVYTRRIKPQ